ncbi:MAG: indole-3-glycerol-phosphate synthase [Desulfonatronovibrionaceae bacterium]
MLDKFIKAKQGEIIRLQELEKAGTMPLPVQGGRQDMFQALAGPGPAVIAEYKRASPSRGLINPGLSPAMAAEMFMDKKAAAVSVLTEEDHFQGSLEYLKDFAFTGLPLLRKDFIFDPLQIRQTAATNAAGVLLIVRVVKCSELLRRLTGLGMDLGLEPVVEVFSRDEVKAARQAGARTILVNNRDLDSLKVDLEVSRQLIRGKQDREVWICASGIETKTQIKEFSALGFDAFLIGTSIMSSPDPGEKLKELTL